MKIKSTFIRALSGTVFIFAANLFQPGATWAQTGMNDMPGMAPASTPAAKKTEPTANPMPASPFADQGKTKSMSEMSPPQPDANKAPNTEGTKSGMRGMRGMDATVGSKAKPMPAMDQAGSPVRARMSIPGVTILGRPQKWEPPSGDDRTSELVSRPALATFQHFLQSSTMPVEDSQFDRVPTFGPKGV